MSRLTNKRILLGVTGGIAAYKSADLIRRLQDEGAEIRVAMTQAAQEFITPLTLQALSNNPVHRDLLDSETESVMGHIELARWADIILIAPASANFIARLAAGQGDDLLTTLCLAATCDIAIAPAMNHAMWDKKTTQDNIKRLTQAGATILQPDDGLQACGETGEGRLMDVPEIVDRVTTFFDQGSLLNRHVVITAGPTREAIDPVRFISNYSSGKQGYALAEAAVEAGAQVTLISGPTDLPAPDRVKRIDVISADDMLSEVMAHIEGADLFIAVAAVADYKPVECADKKLKKSGEAGLSIELVQNPDILKAVAAISEGPMTVGFAAETDNVLEYAKQKLEKKNVDMIIANDVSDGTIGFNSDMNETTVITSAGSESLPRMNKSAGSRALIKIIAARLDKQP